jgi:hypothetical protein
MGGCTSNSVSGSRGPLAQLYRDINRGCPAHGSKFTVTVCRKECLPEICRQLLLLTHSAPHSLRYPGTVACARSHNGRCEGLAHQGLGMHLTT